MDFEREICMRIHLERLLPSPDGLAAIIDAAEGRSSPGPLEESIVERVRRDYLDIRSDAWEEGMDTPGQAEPPSPKMDILGQGDHTRRGLDALGQTEYPGRWIAAFLSDHAQFLFTLSDGARLLTGLTVDFQVCREAGAPLATITSRERLATLPNGVRVSAEVASVSVSFAALDEAPTTVHPWDVMAMVLDSVEQNTNGTVFVLDHEIGRLPENDHFRVRPSARLGECFECRRCGRSWSCTELTAEQWAAGCPAPDCPSHMTAGGWGRAEASQG